MKENKKDINQEINDGFLNILNRIEKDISFIDKLIEKGNGRDEGLTYVYLKCFLDYHRISIVNERGIFNILLSHDRRMDTLLNGILNMRNSLSNIVETMNGSENEGIDNDELQKQLDKIKEDIEEMKPVTDNIRKAFDNQRRWLNNNK